MSTSKEQAESLYEFRKQFRGYVPWNLGKVRGEEMLYEFTAYPWKEADGRVMIYARPIDDSANNRLFEVRKQISPNLWSTHRQKAYKQGFRDAIGLVVQRAASDQVRLSLQRKYDRQDHAEAQL